MSGFQGKYQIKGLYPSTTGGAGSWIRERAKVDFLSQTKLESITLKSAFIPSLETLHSKLLKKTLILDVCINGRNVGSINASSHASVQQRIQLNSSQFAQGLVEFELCLRGVGRTNFLGLLGRLFEKQFFLPKAFRDWLQPFRRQHNNRQVLLQQLFINDELLIDFEKAHSVFDSDFILKNSGVGLNVLGWFHGYLGVGESARACARAATSVGLTVDAVNMNLHLNGGTSSELWGELKNVGSQDITIAHVDAPQSFDLEKKHSAELHPHKYRIGYWAWELPDFPDHWIKYANQFDEIWCPSEFCRKAMGAKLPKPVLSMPHSIQVPELDKDILFWRKRFSLPSEAYLFLFTFDFNSYAPRKNPEAVIDAYRLAVKNIQNPVGLVLKMHGKGYGKGERELIRKLKQELPGLYIVDEALDREELAGLQYACDCFVSLHRSEGFGLGVAEMMAMGKPVISTNWSATAEFVNEDTGCPVSFQLITLKENVGPYTKGQVWADPSVEHATDWMMRLASDPILSKDIGNRAQEHMRSSYSPEAIGRLYLSRIKSIALFQKSCH